MSVDVDRLLRVHAAAAGTVEPRADGWERLVGRLDDEPPVVVPLHGRPPRAGGRRWPALAGAAVLLVALLIAALVLADDGGAPAPPATTGPSPTSARPPTTTTTTTPTTTTTSTTAPPTPVEPGPMPTSAVVVLDPQGPEPPGLRRLDGIGERVEVRDAQGTLVSEVVPPTIGALATGSPGEVTDVDVGPDGTVYYERCCEPAVGEVIAVDGATGEETGFVTFGEAPAVSPDGRRIAVSVQGVGVQLVDVAGGAVTTLVQEPTTAHVVTDLAWSPDGRTLARGLVRLGRDGAQGGDEVHAVEVLDLGASDPAWRPAVPEGAEGWALPAFLADGRVAVATGASGGLDDLTTSGLAVVDLATGDVQRRMGGVSITDLDATPDGRWLVALGGDSALRAFSGDDLVDAGTISQVDGGLRAVAW